MNLWLLMLLFLLSFADEQNAMLRFTANSVPKNSFQIIRKGQTLELRKEKKMFFFSLCLFWSWNWIELYVIMLFRFIGHSYCVHVHDESLIWPFFFQIFVCLWPNDRVVHCYSVKYAYMNTFSLYRVLSFIYS